MNPAEFDVSMPDSFGGVKTDRLNCALYRVFQKSWAHFDVEYVKNY